MKLTETLYNIIKLDENSLVSCADFLAKAKGVSIGSPSVSPEYLKWKYLTAGAENSVCLFIEKDGAICSIVGGMIWQYQIGGGLTNVCFPVDWYSSINSPIKGSGRIVMKALMDKFPVSVAIGGSKMCFQPQIAVGFRDIGDALLLSIDGSMAKGAREMARMAKDFIFHPLCSWRGQRLARSFVYQTNPVFTKRKPLEEVFLTFQGKQLFSRNVPREVLMRKWMHQIIQPFNSADIISVRFNSRISYLFVGEFNDARKGSLVLADALIDPGHTIKDILSAFAAYADSKSCLYALFMTSDQNILKIALLLGYRIHERIRTQYFASQENFNCADMQSCPSISFLSGDEMMYRRPSSESCACR